MPVEEQVEWVWRLLSQGSHGAAVSVLGTHPVCDARELEMGYDTFVVLHW